MVATIPTIANQSANVSSDIKRGQPDYLIKVTLLGGSGALAVFIGWTPNQFV
jgi:hypothetical protein